MSALAKITAHPLTRPLLVYRADFHEFMDVNRVALLDWWEQTKGVSPFPTTTWAEWCEVQFDVTCTLEDAARELEYERSLDRIDAAVLANDGHLM